MDMNREILLWMGAGQIGLAIVRRIGSGKKIVVGDQKKEHAQAMAEMLVRAGFDVVAREADLSSRDSIRSIISEAQRYGPIKYLVNAAGVSPS